MNTERTALKEWAVLVDAMARGDFCAMIRKGGIREQRAGFSVRHDSFLLYPTFFHENDSEITATVRESLAGVHTARPPEGKIILSLLARVRAQWRVTDLDILRGIDGQHGMAWSAVESRFHYRNNPGVHVIAVELLRLPQPVTIPEARRYLGCVSWVELNEEIDVSQACPLREAAQVDAQVQRLRDCLGAPATMEAA